MFCLLKNGVVVSSAGQRRADILISDSTIISVHTESHSPSISIPGCTVEEIDLKGKYVFPGLIDTHCHYLGAAGEAGAHTRAPEVPASLLARAGITTAIGLLGFDHYSRSIENLIAKTRALREAGLTAFCLTGSYSVPTATLTGDVGRDVYFVDEIRGLGEIAISDARSSEPTKSELRRLVKTTLNAARAKGIQGVVVFHIGDEDSGLTPLRDVLEGTHIDSKSIIATHINRNSQLMREVLDFDLGDMWVDLTAIYFDTDHAQGEFFHVEDAITHLLQQRPELINRLTVTSDCGTCIRMHQATPPRWLYRAFRATAATTDIGLGAAVQIFMENPASAFGLINKGKIEKGMDADLIVADEDLSIHAVFARGRCVFGEGSHILDHYEPYES
jgi:beta-aspartyl-dipeptidase (metallo-type)